MISIEIGSKRKWLYLELEWLYENRDSTEDVWMLLDEIFAEFDYPGAIRPFIPWLPRLPGVDGYDPTIHTLAENHARLFRLWHAYLLTTRASLLNQ